MKPLMISWLVALLTAALSFGQAVQSEKPTTQSAVCSKASLPADIQSQLQQHYGSWKIQEAPDLSKSARERWTSEEPIACPGIATGRFENNRELAYAVLLVPEGNADSGYRFLVFSRKTAQSSHHLTPVESSDRSGARNVFLHRAPLIKFFDHASRKKFQAQTADGILLVDSGENEYGVDVYFWSGGRYRHEPIDY